MAKKKEQMNLTPTNPNALLSKKKRQSNIQDQLFKIKD